MWIYLVPNMLWLRLPVILVACMILGCSNEEKPVDSPEKKEAAENLRRHYPEGKFAGWTLDRIEVNGSITIYFETGPDSERLLNQMPKAKQIAYVKLACPAASDPAYGFIDHDRGQRLEVAVFGPAGTYAFGFCD